MSTFLDWQANKVKEEAKRARVLRNMRRRRTPKKPEPKCEPFFRINRSRLKLRVGARLDSKDAGDLAPGTRVRVVERTLLDDGTERMQVTSSDPKRPLGWVTSVDKKGGQTLLQIDPLRDGVSPNAELAEWVSAIQDNEQRGVEASWLAVLSRDQFRVLRMKQTEDAHSGEYTDLEADGVYCCRGCSRALYHSSHKFHTNTGWPSFADSIAGALERVPGHHEEIICASCSGHIGHVFVHPKHPPPRQERHCVNSVAIRFVRGVSAPPPLTSASAPAPAPPQLLVPAPAPASELPMDLDIDMLSV